MLTSAIAFEINIPRQGIKEEFLILNTEENYEKVLTHRNTRQIKFVEVDRFNSVAKMPVEFIDPRILITVFSSVAELN